MAYRRIAIVAALGSVCVLTARFAAQQTPAPESVIRINVNLVQVDAIVTDSKGKPVTNLTAGDFEVLQDGKPQAITNFVFINIKESKVTAPPVRATAPPKKGQPAPPPPPPVAIRQDQIRRTIALVVDDLGLAADNTVRVRQSLKQWVDDEMRPGDLVAVIRTSAGMGALQQFTSDKRLLYAAIDLVQYHLGRVGVSSFAPLTGARMEGEIDTSLFDDEVQQSYTLGSIGAIQYVLQGLRDLPGRKSMVLFSESMRFTYLDGPGIVPTQATSRGLVEERMRKLADAANRSSVVIYAIDPRGVAYTGLTAEDNTRLMEAADIAQVGSKRTQDLIASYDGMIALAQRTGGLFLHNNDVTGSVREVVNDGDGYYLIGYQPEDATFDEKTRSPKFHSISVRVKQPGLRVRSRTGFFGTPDGELAAAPLGREAQIAKAMASPFNGGSLRVRLTTLFSHDEKTGPYINALFHFNGRDLTFTEEPDGSRKALIDTFAVTFDVDGRPVDSADKTWALRVEAKSYEQMLKNGLIYSMHVPVKKPGAYQMRMVLRDAMSEQLGSASQFIEVPDISKGRLALSGIVLAAESPNAAGNSAERAVAATDPDATPAVRIFKSGTPIVYLYQILNARSGSNKRVQLEVQTRLFREGQQVYAKEPSAVNVEGQLNPKRLVGVGKIQMAQPPPGHYALQVIVTDKLAKDKNQIAAQSMDFEIRQ